MITTIIVDDHPMVRDGLAVMLSARRIFDVVQVCGDAEEAIAYIRKNGCPDVVLSDVRMPGMDGFAMIAKLHRFYPDARVPSPRSFPCASGARWRRRAPDTRTTSRPT